MKPPNNTPPEVKPNYDHLAHDDRVWIILDSAQVISQANSVRIEAVLLATLISQMGILLGHLTKGKTIS